MDIDRYRHDVAWCEQYSLWQTSICQRYPDCYEKCYGSTGTISVHNADAPTYCPGYNATIALLALGASIYIALNFCYRKQAKRKLEGKEEWRMEGLSEEEIAELGEHNPRTFYTI